MTSLSPTRLPKLRTALFAIEGFDVVRVILGLILLTAAGLKIYQFTTEPVISKGFFGSRGTIIAQVEGEFLLGMFLLSGLYPKISRWLGVVCFSAFSLITLWKGLSGESSCGCFGKVHLSPWYTLLLDLLSVLLLLMFRPRSSPNSQWKACGWRMVSAIGASLGLIFLSGLAMATYHRTGFTHEGLIVDDDNLVVLDPESSAEKPFPLLKYIDRGEELAKGIWTVVLYRHDCPHCQELIPKLLRMVRKSSNQINNTSRMCLVEIPPYGLPGDLIPLNSPCLLGRLSKEKKWFVETPLMLVLDNGKVRNRIRNMFDYGYN